MSWWWPPVKPAPGFDPAPFAGDWYEFIQLPWRRWHQPEVDREIEFGRTRLYLGGDQPVIVQPALDASWESSAAPYGYRSAILVPGGITEASASVAAPTAGNDTAFITWVSPPLAADTFLAPLFIRGIGKPEEADPAADLRAQLVVKVVDFGGTTVRGVLLAHDTGPLASEFSDLGLSRFFPVAGRASPLSPVQAFRGDRIVVEWGTRGHAAGAGETNISHRSDTTDLDEVEGSGASLNSWVDIGQVIQFATDAEIIAGATDLSREPIPLPRWRTLPEAQDWPTQPPAAAPFDPAPFAASFVPEQATPWRRWHLADAQDWPESLPANLDQLAASTAATEPAWRQPSWSTLPEPLWWPESLPGDLDRLAAAAQPIEPLSWPWRRWEVQPAREDGHPTPPVDQLAVGPQDAILTAHRLPAWRLDEVQAWPERLPDDLDHLAAAAAATEPSWRQPGWTLGEVEPWATRLPDDLDQLAAATAETGPAWRQPSWTLGEVEDWPNSLPADLAALAAGSQPPLDAIPWPRWTAGPGDDQAIPPPAEAPFDPAPFAALFDPEPAHPLPSWAARPDVVHWPETLPADLDQLAAASQPLDPPGFPIRLWELGRDPERPLPTPPIDQQAAASQAGLEPRPWASWRLAGDDDQAIGRPFDAATDVGYLDRADAAPLPSWRLGEVEGWPTRLPDDLAQLAAASQAPDLARMWGGGWSLGPDVDEAIQPPAAAPAPEGVAAWTVDRQPAGRWVGWVYVDDAVVSTFVATQAGGVGGFPPSATAHVHRPGPTATAHVAAATADAPEPAGRADAPKPAGGAHAPKPTISGAG